MNTTMEQLESEKTNIRSLKLNWIISEQVAKTRLENLDAQIKQLTEKNKDKVNNIL